MDVTPVIARLKAQLTGFVSIGGAADLDAAIEGTPNAPAAYVLPLGEGAAEPYLGAGVTAQTVTQGFGVVLVAQNLQDARGEAASKALAPMRAQVRQALLGWAPVPAEGQPVRFSAGRLLQFAQGRLWWTDEWLVDTDIRSA